MYLLINLPVGFTSGLLYLGPETMMPLVSLLAALIGIILIFWRYIFSFIKKIFKIKGKPSATEQEITPFVEPDDDEGPGN
jgi:hypothetical protein